MTSEDRSRNFIKRGGTQEPSSPEKQAQDHREATTLMVFYTSPADIPPSPKEPPQTDADKPATEVTSFGELPDHIKVTYPILPRRQLYVQASDIHVSRFDKSDIMQRSTQSRSLLRLRRLLLKPTSSTSRTCSKSSRMHRSNSLLRRRRRRFSLRHRRPCLTWSGPSACSASSSLKFHKFPSSQPFLRHQRRRASISRKYWL